MSHGYQPTGIGRSADNVLKRFRAGTALSSFLKLHQQGFELLDAVIAAFEKNWPLMQAAEDLGNVMSTLHFDNYKAIEALGPAPRVQPDWMLERPDVTGMLLDHVYDLDQLIKKANFKICEAVVMFEGMVQEVNKEFLGIRSRPAPPPCPRWFP